MNADTNSAATIPLETVAGSYAKAAAAVLAAHEASKLADAQSTAAHAAYVAAQRELGNATAALLECAGRV